jgi:hypothetical protein
MSAAWTSLFITGAVSLSAESAFRSARRFFLLRERRHFRAGARSPYGFNSLFFAASNSSDERAPASSSCFS